MTLKLISHVAIKAQVVKKVVALKNAVFFDHPKMFFADKRLEDRYSYVGMVIRTKSVTNVVKESSNNVFVGLVSPVVASGGLQGMFHPVDRESAVVTF